MKRSRNQCSISVNGKTYERFRCACKFVGNPMGTTLAQLINDYIDLQPQPNKGTDHETLRHVPIQIPQG